MDKCDFFTAALHRAGLKPLIIDHDAFAVFNCFNFLNRKQGGAVFMLNVGHKVSNIVLSEKGGFVLSRDIPFGGRNLTGIVASGRNISPEEAEIYRSKEENREDVEKIIASGIEELLSELKASVGYFASRTGKSPDKLFLTGGASVFPGVADALGQNMKINTVLWNPLENLSDIKAYSMPEEIKKKGTMFAVCLGLVLRKIK